MHDRVGSAVACVCACAFALTVISCAGVIPGPSGARTNDPVRCPPGVLAALPRDIGTWVFLRPSAILSHPRLGPALAHVFEDAGETALIRRAVRVGYDVRTIERAAIGWRGASAMYVAAGPIDGPRVVSLLWDRMLNPRRRTRDDQNRERVEGTVGRTTVGLMVSSACRMAAYAEADTTPIDRLAGADGRPDPSSLLVWHAARPPSGIGTEADALMERVRSFDLVVADDAAGVRVRVELRGSLPSDVRSRLARASRAFIESPLGDLSGAVQWLDAERDIAATGETATITVHVPWRALAALSDALRGRIVGVNGG